MRLILLAMFYLFGQGFSVAATSSNLFAEKLSGEGKEAIIVPLNESAAPLKFAQNEEIVFWQSVKDSNDRDQFKAYLDAYPDGVFSSLARIKINKIGITEKENTQNTGIIKTEPDYYRGLEAYKLGDYATTLKEWVPLAKQGDSDAQFNLAVMYYNGRGVAQDYEAALKWFTLAAKQGDSDAQFNLALMFDNGQGIPQDDQVALKWYTRAAEQGYSSALANLGAKYANGEGVAQDYITALKWLAIAADRGSETAKKNIVIVEKELSHTQIEAARKQARDWQVKPENDAAAVEQEAKSPANVSPNKSPNVVSKQLSQSETQWIQIASRQNMEEAIHYAKKYSGSIKEIFVLSTTSGWYVVAIGPIPKSEIGDQIEKMVLLGQISDDSIRSEGTTYISVKWQSGAAQINARSTTNVAVETQEPKSESKSDTDSVDECDRLAAYGQDEDRIADPVSFEDLENHAEEAIIACLTASKSEPDEPRLRFQLGRSYLAAGNEERGLENYLELEKENYPAAMLILGYYYEMGSRGLLKDRTKAASLYKKSYEAGNSKAGEAFAEIKRQFDAELARVAKPAEETKKNIAFNVILEGHSAEIESVAISPDNGFIVTGSWDTTARIWDAETGKFLRELKGHSGVIRSVAISPDSSFIVTGSSDDTARIWNAKTGSLVRELKGPEGSVYAVTISPDASIIVTAHNVTYVDMYDDEYPETATLGIWDVKKGTLIRKFDEGETYIYAVSIDPEGTGLVAGLGGGTLGNGQLLSRDIKTGNKLPAKKFDRSITSFGISSKGQYLVIGDPRWNSLFNLMRAEEGEETSHMYTPLIINLKTGT